jgi:ElaB/YqjD/DUF883 family membrane-anchored ribosome-binding protein
VADISGERTSATMSDMARGQAERAAQAAEDVTRRVAERGRQASEGMQDVASNFSGALDKSLRDQPMATLAVAAALGFVLGALWKT